MGALTRALCYDLTKPGWYPVDFPFSVSVIKQVLLNPLAPVTLLGGFQDGLIQRWQYGDFLWLTLGPSPIHVNWFYRTPITASQNPDQRVFVQEISIKGVNSHGLGAIAVTPTIDGFGFPSRPTLIQYRNTGSDFLAVASVMITGQRFFADIFGSGGVEIDGDNFHMSPKPLVGRLVIA
jgi:hypothetical protein